MRQFFMVALALASSACSRSTAVAVTETRAASVDVPVYDGSVAINPASRRLNAKWSIRFVADSATTDSVELLLNAGLNVSRVSGQNVAGYVARPRDDRQSVMVQLKQQLAPGGVGQIDLEYGGVPVFGSDSINGIAPTWVELGLDSHCFPARRCGQQRRLLDPCGYVDGHARSRSRGILPALSE